MAASRKPRMVDRWRLDGSFQPFLARQVRMYGFVFPVEDIASLTALCDRYLNRPTGDDLHYTPWLPLVLVTFTRIGRLSSQGPPYADVGWAVETEATFWVFAPRMELGFMPARLTWFVPYLFTDLPLAISQGREIYGFPKEIGYFESPSPGNWLAVPADGPHADRFTLDALAVERFGETAAFERRRLLEIAREPGGGHRPVVQRWRSHADAITGVRAVVGAAIDHRARRPGRWQGIDLEPWPPGGTIVLLKQIHSAADSAVASLQSIVEVEAEVTAFRGGGPLHGEYHLDLRSLESHPLAADLGLASGATALASYWLDLDFRLMTGHPVWSAEGAPDSR